MFYYMKKLFQAVLIFGVSSVTFGQATKTLFETVDESVYSTVTLDLIDDYTLLSPESIGWQDVLNNHPHHITVNLPFGEEILTLNLRQATLFKPDFRVRTASGTSVDLESESKSIFYQGWFEGYENSHFALSVLENEIIGVGNIEGIGDLNLGKLKDYEHYIFYAESALENSNDFLCETRGDYGPMLETDGSSRDLIADCSSIYFEVDYDIFLDKGGVTEASDYILALFNEIQILFDLDGMTIYISDMLVWDEESPYFGIGDTGTLLDLFGVTTTVWEGDLGHLVTISAGGGLAWVNVFCSADQVIRKAVSGIGTSFAPVPTYSWSVEVVAHEMGHNMGSPHTHACAWNGDMTAIDGCGPSAGFDEGCEGDLPPEGGTVMSYCHLTDVGIDLGQGFGEQPGTLMRTNIIESACLESCDLTEMDIEVINGGISSACDNLPVNSSIEILNKSNEPLTFATLSVYFDGVLAGSYPWSGFVPIGGTKIIFLPAFTKPVGLYSMSVVLDFPDGYDDENPADNDYVVGFEVHPFPTADFEIKPDKLISLDATTTVYNYSEGATSYQWNFNDGTPLVNGFSVDHTFPFNRGGNYNVQLVATSQFGCRDTAYASVFVEGYNIYYIPNSFVPETSTFQPVFSAGLDVHQYHFVVYNRWGEVMFESYDATKGWDGTYGGRKEAPTGVYAWIIEFGDLTSDEKHTLTGHVNLLK